VGCQSAHSNINIKEAKAATFQIKYKGRNLHVQNDSRTNNDINSTGLELDQALNIWWKNTLSLFISGTN
jgi:hypothetical protein